MLGAKRVGEEKKGSQRESVNKTVHGNFYDNMQFLIQVGVVMKTSETLAFLRAAYFGPTAEEENYPLTFALLTIRVFICRRGNRELEEDECEPCFSF